MRLPYFVRIIVYLSMMSELSQTQHPRQKNSNQNFSNMFCKADDNLEVVLPFRSKKIFANSVYRLLAAGGQASASEIGHDVRRRGKGGRKSSHINPERLSRAPVKKKICRRCIEATRDLHVSTVSQTLHGLHICSIAQIRSMRR